MPAVRKTVQVASKSIRLFRKPGRLPGSGSLIPEDLSSAGSKYCIQFIVKKIAERKRLDG